MRQTQGLLGMPGNLEMAVASGLTPSVLSLFSSLFRPKGDPQRMNPEKCALLQTVMSRGFQSLHLPDGDAGELACFH